MPFASVPADADAGERPEGQGPVDVLVLAPQVDRDLDHPFSHEPGTQPAELLGQPELPGLASPIPREGQVHGPDAE